MKNTRKVLGFAVIIAAIAFNAATAYAVTIPTAGVTELTADKWSDGNIAAANGEQWFKFTATAANQYIHFMLGTMTSGKVQLYTADGNTSGASTNLGTVTNMQRAVTVGTVYYINVKPFTGKGTYRIGFNTTSTIPTIAIPATGVTQLPANTWTNGNLTAAGGGEQWFKFTSTGTSQYVHFELGTTPGVYVQLFAASGAPVGTRKTIFGSTFSASQSGLTNNTDYYIMLNYTLLGTYKIGLNTSSTAPAITVPSANVTQLNADEWKDGNIATEGGEQWYKFTAAAATQYIHFQPGTLTDTNVRLYVAAGTTVGTVSNLSASGFITTDRTVTSGAEYFLRVTPYLVAAKGTYKIGVNATPVTPKVVTTMPNATQLTVDKWSDGSIASTTGEQWFKFTATGATHVIHFKADKLANAYVQLYTGDGRLSEGRSNLSAGAYSSYASRKVNAGTEYYIKVSPSSSNSGAFKIGVTTSNTAPTN